MKIKTLKKVSEYLQKDEIFFHEDSNEVTCDLSQNEIDELIKMEIGYTVKKKQTIKKHLTRIINESVKVALSYAKEKDENK